eukprot:SAG22_NODE_2982_length_2052_cov_6.410138_3_plen_78_part_00
MSQDSIGCAALLAVGVGGYCWQSWGWGVVLGVFGLAIGDIVHEFRGRQKYKLDGLVIVVLVGLLVLAIRCLATFVLL